MGDLWQQKYSYLSHSSKYGAYAPDAIEEAIMRKFVGD